MPLADGLQFLVGRDVLEEHHVDESDEEVGGAVLTELIVRVFVVGVVEDPFHEDHEQLQKYIIKYITALLKSN